MGNLEVIVSQNDVFASLAEFEREIIRERTMAGTGSSQSEGKKPGLSKEAMKKIFFGKATVQKDNQFQI